MITIDSEFQSLIPALSAEEYGQLEENILHDGIRDALIVWDGILLDGHNRYEIAQKYDLPYEVQEMAFDSREEAKIWVIQNQFGRRNLNAFCRSELVEVLKPLLAEQAKKRMLAGKADPTQKSAEGGETRDKLAKLAGVSHDTLAKVEKIKQVASLEMIEALRRGDISVNRAVQTIKREE